MVIFINGSINSGKSTVAKLLSKKMGNAVVLEIDVLRNFVEWLPLEEAISINWENAFALIKNFVKHDLNVLVPYPISQKNYDVILENLKNIHSEIYFFTLSPPLETVLKNRGRRNLSGWEIDRIKYHYKIGINNPSFGVVIDNANETPAETADKIQTEVKRSFLGKRTLG